MIFSDIQVPSRPPATGKHHGNSTAIVVPQESYNAMFVGEILNIKRSNMNRDVENPLVSLLAIGLCHHSYISWWVLANGKYLITCTLQPLSSFMYTSFVREVHNNMFYTSSVCCASHIELHRLMKAEQAHFHIQCSEANVANALCAIFQLLLL